MRGSNAHIIHVTYLRQKIISHSLQPPLTSQHRKGPCSSVTMLSRTWGHCHRHRNPSPVLTSQEHSIHTELNSQAREKWMTVAVPADALSHSLRLGVLKLTIFRKPLLLLSCFLRNPCILPKILDHILRQGQMRATGRAPSDLQ